MLFNRFQLAFSVVILLALTACQSEPSAVSDSASCQQAPPKVALKAKNLAQPTEANFALASVPVVLNEEQADKPLEWLSHAGAFRNNLGLKRRFDGLTEEDYWYSGFQSLDSTIQADKGALIVSNRMTISVPEQAFVDRSGKPVSGAVRLKLETYHNPFSMIKAGIPMKTPTANGLKQLESNGMFRLEGWAGDQPVEIASGKSVQLSIQNEGLQPNYDFYQFDPKKQNWTKLADAKSKGNQNKEWNTIKLERNGLSVQACEYVDQATGKRCISLKRARNMRPATNQNRAFQQKRYQKRINGDSLTFEIKESRRNRYKSENKNEKMLGNRSFFYARLFKYPNDGKIDSTMKKRSSYCLILDDTIQSVSGNISLDSLQLFTNLIRIDLYPTSRFESTLDTLWKSNGGEVTPFEHRGCTGDNLPYRASVARTVALGKFGLYNFDRLVDETGLITLRPDFQLEGLSAEQWKNAEFYIVYKNLNTAYKFHPQTEDLKLLDKPFRICALLPDDSPFILSEEDVVAFRKQAQKPEKPVFALKALTRTVEGISVLQNYLMNVNWYSDDGY